MKKVLLISLSALALAACQQPSNSTSAPVAMRTAVAGIPRALYFVYSVDHACNSAGDNVIRVVQAPVHGKLSINAVSDYPDFAPSAAFHTCNTTQVAGKKLVYTADRGYSGTDSVAVQVIYAGGVERTYSFNLNVK